MNCKSIEHRRKYNPSYPSKQNETTVNFSFIAEKVSTKIRPIIYYQEADNSSRQTNTSSDKWYFLGQKEHSVVRYILKKCYSLRFCQDMNKLKVQKTRPKNLIYHFYSHCCSTFHYVVKLNQNPSENLQKTNRPMSIL